jgi:hypothetical protein
MKNNFQYSYPIKVWILTIVIGPFIIGLITSMGIKGSADAGFLGFLSIVIFIILFGLIFSKPSFVIYYTSFFFLKRWLKSYLLLKFLLTGVALVSMLISVYIVYRAEYKDKGVMVSLCYGVIMLILGFLLPIREKQI